jgi:hypothetical protein
LICSVSKGFGGDLALAPLSAAPHRGRAEDDQHSFDVATTSLVGERAISLALFAIAIPLSASAEVWPELLLRGATRPAIIELDDPGGPEPAWPELRDANENAGPDPEMLAAKLAEMDVDLVEMRKAHRNPPAKSKPGGFRRAEASERKLDCLIEIGGEQLFRGPCMVASRKHGGLSFSLVASSWSLCGMGLALGAKSRRTARDSQAGFSARSTLLARAL